MLPQLHPTKYWHQLENGRVQCDLCPQACKLNEGQPGICLVRMRVSNQIVLATYGRSSGFAVDPIEKKPLNHFLPGSQVYSFGTAGCNLLCKFCQNWDISKAHETALLNRSATPEAIALTAKKLGCQSVAFTYNEPIIFMEYAIDVAKECHKLGLKTVAVTNGYICDQPRQEFFSSMDAVNVDLKGFTEKFYQKITGAHLQPVLDTLLYLKKQAKVWLEITTLLIPDENDAAAEIEELTLWIKENLGVAIPIHFTGFYPSWKMLNKPRTPLATLVQARKIAIQNGLRYVYTGNLYNPDGSKTFCHNCGQGVIIRAGYKLLAYHLDPSGKCQFCHSRCSGVFS